ncbi:MAG: ABC transporter ATP-binding protein [Limisphaerales bacterium]
MTNPAPAIEIRGLVRRFGRTEAVHGLDLTVPAGSCYGFFGRNGAGKTTTIKCLLNLLKPDSGTVRVFGLDPARQELEVKRRIAYVPDQVAFYPWMSVRDALDYAASFRTQWNVATEAGLLERFRLDTRKPVTGLSKGQRTQLALISAICPDPELLILDEPTSGLDPIVRREFIEAVIGAYQDADPSHRTVFVSTHLITEFEGLIDRFTIVNEGKALVSLESDEARSKYRRLRARFAGEPPALQHPGILRQSRNGRDLDVVTNGATEQVLEEIRKSNPEDIQSESLSLEEIFVVANG